MVLKKAECCNKNKPDINICPHCGADLFEVGVVEAISGGYSETEIHFKNGETKTGITVIHDFDEQWALCGKCKERIEYTAVDAFEILHPPEKRAPNEGIEQEDYDKR